MAWENKWINKNGENINFKFANDVILLSNSVENN